MVNILQGAMALGLLWSVMTVGVYLTFRVLDIADLTVEGSIVLGASVTAVVIYQGGSPYLALGASLLAGLLAGLATGLMQTKLMIPPLLSGILSMIALYSINIRVMSGAANISLLRKPTVFSGMMEAGLSKNLSVILVGLLCAVLVVLMVWWFLGTELGCAIRATGNSPQMAKAQGIHTDRAKLVGLSLSNSLVGFSGGMISQYLGYSDVQMGAGSIVIGLASLIIGEVLFAQRGGLARILISIVLGSVAYRMIIAMVFEAGMPSTDLKLFTAVTVALALYLPTLKEQLHIRFKLKKEEDGDAQRRSGAQDFQQRDGQ
jgi:putative ABC transport system permease protein